MNKNLFLRLCLMMGVFSIVFSCKTELLEDESTNPTTKNAIAKQILFKELEKQAPQIAKKVSKFSPVNISARTYTDSENDFSIDTEKSLYIEDAKGNKTYTFKMTRAENNESVLENLVLKDIGNGEFEAYIATYDSYALQNYSNLSLEDVKNHITMVYIGDRLGSDIFGKANAYTCYVMAPEFVDVYYTGMICGANLHYYGQTCNDEIKPTPGYTITTVQYTPYDMCEGGGASAGSGDGSGVSTSPYGYNGGGGGIYDGVLLDPCQKLKTDLARAKVIRNNSNITNQNNQLTSTIVSDTNEKGFAFGKDSNGNYQAGPIENLGTNGGSLTLNNLGFTVEGDFHNHNGPNTPSCFSATDIYGFYDSHATISSYNIKFVNGSDNSQYVLTITDQDAFDIFVLTYNLNTVDAFNQTTNPTGTILS